MKFIVFEGIDGSGKSTQARLLAQALQARGLPVLATRQPSDGAVGKVMRSATDGILPLENETMALLVAADRFQHVHDEIKPALAAGKFVICDRFYHSSFAFQGIDDGAFARVAAYNAQVIASQKPDITFFLDVPPEECMHRITAGRNYGGRYDSVAQLTAVRARYLQIFAQVQPEEIICMLNGSASKEAIAAQVLATIFPA